MAKYKEEGRCKYLIAMGCLVQRYYDELIKALPEVDLFIRIDEYNNLWEKIEDLLKRDVVVKSKNKYFEKVTDIKQLPLLDPDEFLERVVTTGKNYAYLKIGEGCSNKCTYCAIPYIRGPFVSRRMEDILEEAEKLASEGIKEIIVIAQDTTKYGEDIYGKSRLAELLQEISKIDGIEWIRFLYSYPEGITEVLKSMKEGITDELIDTVANNPKIAKYFDIPIQHISNVVLKRMNRKTSKEKIENLLEKIRNKIPNVTLRTSLIVGFPGETEEQFGELLEFVKKAKFDKLGTFLYSKEEGTPASRLPEQIHGNTKKARYNKIMKAQKQISLEKQENKIGKTYKVLVEDISFDGKYFVGRTMQDVPEEDGLVYIKDAQNYKQEDILNHFIECQIEEVSEYDLIGKIV